MRGAQERCNKEKFEWEALWDAELLNYCRFIAGGRAKRCSYDALADLIANISDVRPERRQVENRMALLRSTLKLWNALGAKNLLNELLDTKQGARPSERILEVASEVPLSPAVALRAARLIRKRRRVFLAELAGTVEEDLEFLCQSLGVEQGYLDDSAEETTENRKAPKENVKKKKPASRAQTPSSVPAAAPAALSEEESTDEEEAPTAKRGKKRVAPVEPASSTDGEAPVTKRARVTSSGKAARQRK